MSEVIPTNFISQIVEHDLAVGKHGTINTRFPPEPNGFLHIGHAKSICLNFGIASQFHGTCNLRFDDTNPEKESQVYIDAIQEDVQWLGFQWLGDIRYASDYFDQLRHYAIELIEKGLAYVDELTSEQIREYRGTLTSPGKLSPYRDRSIEDNKRLFEKMCAGDFKEGACVLRAKIDMASPNVNMRDPVLYRVKFATHHQTGDKWCVYPMYDYTHCVSDALENITHSLCTLEFEDHRPLYDWVLDNISIGSHPRQIEFARLNLNYTITSKRKLKRLIDEGIVSSWDDPRLPTISGLRRRGIPAAALRTFCREIGVTKSDSVVDMGMLDAQVRDYLDKKSDRAMCVLTPLKVIITNYPEEKRELLQSPLHPKEERGHRELPFAREVFIDAADFEENPPPKYFRLALGKEVRLRSSYVIRCESVEKDEAGKVIALHCTYDEKTLGKKPEGRKVKGVIHWVEAKTAVPCEVRLYDRLFTVAAPESEVSDDKAADFLSFVNPNALQTLEGCLVESSIMDRAVPEASFQFEREGYFCVDRYDSSSDHLVFNKTISLRDSWS